MKLIGLGLGIGALLLLAACSSGGGDVERVLVLGAGDFTEQEFRLQLRTGFLSAMPSARSLCAGLEGLSDREAAEVLAQAQDERGTPTVQPPVAADRERAAAIIKEECNRIG